MALVVHLPCMSTEHAPDGDSEALAASKQPRGRGSAAPQLLRDELWVVANKGLTYAARELGLSRESIRGILSGCPVLPGTVALAEKKLAEYRVKRDAEEAEARERRAQRHPANRERG